MSIIPYQYPWISINYKHFNHYNLSIHRALDQVMLVCKELQVLFPDDGNSDDVSDSEDDGSAALRRKKRQARKATKQREKPKKKKATKMKEEEEEETTSADFRKSRFEDPLWYIYICIYIYSI